MSFATSSVFKGHTDAFPASVLIIGRSICLKTFRTPHFSRSTPSLALFPAAFCTDPTWFRRCRFRGESSLPSAFQTCLETQQLNLVTLRRLAGRKFHCFHFLNPAAIKEGERVGARCSRRLFAPFFFFFFFAKPSSVTAGLSVHPFSRSSLPMCLGKRGFGSTRNTTGSKSRVEV